jgi:hypothetical protein
MQAQSRAQAHLCHVSQEVLQAWVHHAPQREAACGRVAEGINPAWVPAQEPKPRPDDGVERQQDEARERQQVVRCAANGVVQEVEPAASRAAAAVVGVPQQGQHRAAYVVHAHGAVLGCAFAVPCLARHTHTHTC